MRGPARCGLVVLAAALGAACGDVRSIEPAVRDADAVEQPALVGRWVIPDTSQIDIARLPGQEPRYVLQTRSLEAQRDTADFGTDADSVTWFDARVGRVGGRLVLELKASERSDPTLASVARTYAGSLLPTNIALPFELRGDELRMSYLDGDSTLALLRRGACSTPYYVADSSSSVLLTGRSAQVREALECVTRRPGTLRVLGAFRRARAR